MILLKNCSLHDLKETKILVFDYETQRKSINILVNKNQTLQV